MLRVEQLDRAIAETEDLGDQTLGDLVPVPHPERLSAAEFPHLHADQSLDSAMRRLAETGLKVLPVVSRTNIRELKGTISMQDILAAYAMGKVEEEAEPMLPKGKPAALLAGVLAVLIGLGVVAGLLSYYYRSERTGRAQHFYETGNQFLLNDRYDEAIGQFREALSISHTNQNRLALALALVKAGHPDEATIYLTDLLRSDPTSGEANLGMARVAAQAGRIDEAVGYYHHAIDGAWPANTADRRIQARLELIQALGKAGRRQQAQAELLSIPAMGPSGLSVKKQVAQLSLQHGLAREAANLFRDLIERDAQDQQAWAGLGEAEYELGDYPAARDALAGALRLNPNDTAARKLLDAATGILALDPLRRGLGAAERYRRSQAVLAAVLDVLDPCSSLKGQMASARKLLAKGDAVDNITSAAEQLWTAGAKSCSSMPPADAPLSRIMARLMAR
jgi:tetratricopeptide (TPR) repeat protein